jgi:tRNA(Ile)-lysidine synthase
MSLPGDVEMRSEGDRLVFSRVGAPEVDASALPQVSALDEIRMQPPCTVALAGGWLLEAVEKDVAVSIENVSADPRAEAIYDADALGPNLTLRPPGPGDRMTVFGAQGSKKLSDLFQQHRIPVNARACWLVGIRRADSARVGPRTRRVLHLRLRAPCN